MEGNKTILGACSICGGRVSVPTIYHSIIPPTPKCESCGAVRAENGPVIPMRPGRVPHDHYGHHTCDGTPRRYC